MGGHSELESSSLPNTHHLKCIFSFENLVINFLALTLMGNCEEGSGMMPYRKPTATNSCHPLMSSLKQPFAGFKST